MPVAIAMLIGGLVSAAGSFVGRALLSLGIGFIAYSGIDVAISGLLATATANGGALPMGLAGMLGVLKIGTGLNIIMSAITVRLVLAGMTSGVVRRMAFGVGDIRRVAGS